jgi:hypothetical protein
METLAPIWIYVTVLLVAYLENVVPPIPGDMVIVFAGYLVGLGVVGFGPVLIMASLGGVLGFLTMYLIGWIAGPAVFDTERARWIPKRGALGWRSSMVEQLICNQQVGGSSPFASSTGPASERARLDILTGRYRSGQTGQTVNLLAHAFGGSNPPLPTARAGVGTPRAGVAQLVEHQPSKLRVAGSNPVSRSATAAARRVALPPP